MVSNKKWKLAALIVLVVVCLVALVACWSAIFAFVKKTGGKLNIQQSELSELAKCDIRTKFPVAAGTYQEFAAYDSLALSGEGFPEKDLILYWFHSLENGSQGKLVALNLLTCETEWTVVADEAVDNLDFVKFIADKWEGKMSGYLMFGKEIQRDEKGLNEGFNGGELWKLDLYNGKVLWKYSFAKGAPYLLNLSEKQILIGVKKNFILLNSQAGDNLIIAIDKEDGNQLWKYKVKTNDANWSFATDEFSKVCVPATTLTLDINTGKIK